MSEYFLSIPSRQSPNKNREINLKVLQWVAATVSWYLNGADLGTGAQLKQAAILGVARAYSIYFIWLLKVDVVGFPREASLLGIVVFF